MKGSTLFLILLMTAAAVQADPRQWNHAGIPIRQGHHIAWQKAAAQDAAGNTVMVWSDARNGDRDVYAQLISPAGAVLWTPDGVNVCNRAPARQSDPAVCAVTGGWIIAWIDFRADSFAGDVWAQKLDNNGNAVWTGNNSTGMPVDVNPSLVFEYSVRVVHDGNGGAIIAWEDGRRDPPGDIFAAHITSGGTNDWAGALHVTWVDGTQSGITVDGDGSGNMLVAWQDGRDLNNQNIYAAKITADGQLPWGGENGVLVCGTQGRQFSPSLCSDGQGGCYVSWIDQRNSTDDIYMQRMNSSGVAQWTTDGVVLCNAASRQEDVRVATSTNGGTPDGCLAVWTDTRVNNNTREIYAQKMTPEGTSVWAANGIRVCGDAQLPDGGESRYVPVVVSDLAGGLTCAWEDAGPGDDYQTANISAGRVLAGGTLGWTGECGVQVANGPNRQSAPVIVTVTDGALVLYDDQRSGSQSLRFQKLAISDGSRQLPDTGVIAISGLDADANRPAALAMSSGRTAIVWQDGRLTSGGVVLTYQIVHDDGQIERPLNGARLAPDNEGYSFAYQTNPRLCPDGNGGFFAVYEDWRTGTKQVRISHVNSAGDVAGSQAGQVVYHDSLTMTDQNSPYCTPDGSGGCFVAWSNYNRSYFIDLFMMRMNANGQRAWNLPVQLTDTQTDDIVHGLVSNPDGCCTVVWRSGAYGNRNISAAKVRGDGSVVYNQDVCDAINEQDDPAVVADPEGGAYFAWTDDGVNSTHPFQGEDIYAQRLDAQGQESWTHNGIPVISDTLTQRYPSITLTGDGDLAVVWQDFRSGRFLDLYGQMISPAGTLLWQEHGVIISDAAGDQSDQAIMRDSDRGLFLVWADGRGTYPQVYGTHLDSDGNPTGDSYWVLHSGGALSDPVNQWQSAPAFASDSAGGFVAVWVDQRASNEEPVRDLYAQHITDAAGVNERPASLPKTYALSQNYPNPFNPTTVISFALPKAGMTTLRVYDILGRQVNTLVSRVMPAGNHSVNFDAGRFSSGIYFYRLTSGSFSSTKKMIMLK